MTRKRLLQLQKDLEDLVIVAARGTIDVETIEGIRRTRDYVETLIATP